MPARVYPPRRLLAGASIALLALGVAASRQLSPAAANPTTVTACPSRERPATLDAAPGYVTVTFTNECGETVPIAVDIAATESQQERGLMGVSNLPADEGELFVFQNLAGGREVQVGFWMEDTPIPLSIAFIGSDGTVHEVQDMQAETITVHLPRQPYLYAVEANLGWFAQHEVIPGSVVDLSPALTQLSSVSRP